MFKHAKVSLVALGALAFGSLAGVGCAVDDGSGDEFAELEIEESDTGETGTTPANLEPGRYCVDQSYASIQYVDVASCGGLPCTCPNQLTPHAQFSRNHPVNVHLYGCGPYYFVKDLWSDNYGWMRQDALRPC